MYKYISESDVIAVRFFCCCWRAQRLVSSDVYSNKRRTVCISMIFMHVAHRRYSVAGSVCPYSLDSYIRLTFFFFLRTSLILYMRAQAVMQCQCQTKNLIS